MTPLDPQAPTHDLISLALCHLPADEEDGTYWAAVRALRARGTREVFEAAAALVASPCAVERELGANIHSQLGHTHGEPFSEESSLLLVRLLETEDDTRVVCAALFALNFLHEPVCVPAAVRLSGHPDEDVRYAVTFALSGHEDDQAVTALIALTTDPSARVREWATFALGTQADRDNQPVCTALWARTADSDCCVRGEALKGLAKRTVPGTVEATIAELSGSEPCAYAVDAAELLADARLVPALERLREEWPDWQPVGGGDRSVPRWPTMLSTTRKLIDGLRAAPPGGHAGWVLANARVAIVARHGGPEDAEALLDLFLEDPTEYQRASVLDAVMRVGTRDTARWLAAGCLAAGQLRAGVQTEVLHALGFLGYTDVRDVLWNHATGGTDYYEQKSAALGLLNLPCDGLEREIEAAIRACAGKSLFPEFLPVLAHKIGNPELLPLLFDMGQTTASTDCNGGLVYGIALFGDAGRSYFDRLLFDPHWETYGAGTGTGGWAYHGFRHLGGSVAEMARQLRAWHPTVLYKSWEYRLRVWFELVGCWLHDSLPPRRSESYTPERAVDVCAAAFDWSSANGDDSLSGLVRNDGWVPKHEVYALRDRLDDRIAAEEARSASASLA